MFIKICGITSDEDARTAASAGASAIGLNFYPPSPRYVSVDQALTVMQHVPPYVVSVGLFVDSTAAEIRQTAQVLGIQTVQLHGTVTPELVLELREFSVITAFALSDAAGVSGVLEFIAECARRGRPPGAVLVDGAAAGQYGGTGQLASWSAARELVARSSVPVILAGGLTGKNVGEAIHQVGPWGVDVSSGVEVAPGRKEAFKVNRFVAESRRAFNLLARPARR